MMNDQPQHWTPQVIIAALVTVLITSIVCYLAVTVTDTQERAGLIGALIGAPGFGGAMFALGATQGRRATPTANVEQAGVVNQAAADPAPVREIR